MNNLAKLRLDATLLWNEGYRRYTTCWKCHELQRSSESGYVNRDYQKHIDEVILCVDCGHNFYRGVQISSESSTEHHLCLSDEEYNDLIHRVLYGPSHTEAK